MAIVGHTGSVLGWVVLTLVFVDELFAVAAAAIWGEYVGGVVVAVVLPLIVIGFWSAFASPRARFGGPVLRPVVKVVVFTLASLGLWRAGHGGWALALFGFSVVINALAQVPSVQALTERLTTD